MHLEMTLKIKKYIKREFQEYTICFFTFVLFFMVFYSFNTIVDNKVILGFNNSDPYYLNSLREYVSMVSILSCIMLDLLIVQQINIIVENRIEEFKKSICKENEISEFTKKMVFDVFLVQIVSLIVALFLAIILSKRLIMFTNNLFNFQNSSYGIIISTYAIKKTLLYFSISLILVSVCILGITSKKSLTRLMKKIKNTKNRIRIFMEKTICILIMTIVLFVNIGVLSKGIDFKNILDQYFGRSNNCDDMLSGVMFFMSSQWAIVMLLSSMAMFSIKYLKDFQQYNNLCNKEFNKVESNKNNRLLISIIVYFTIPSIMVIIFSSISMKVFFKGLVNMQVSYSIVMISSVIMLLYSVYFYVTYMECKYISNIKEYLSVKIE